jgi:hypothetical protein
MVDVSLVNSVDGNINHDAVPLTSYGVIPGLALRYESSADPVVRLGYDVAANTFTATDRWDRISHGLFAVISTRAGKRWRFDTTGDATWRGASDDRELANVFGAEQRVQLRVGGSVRLSAIASYRYKQYPGDPDTSGAVPTIGGKTDVRLAHGHRFTVSFRDQKRLSRAVRDRYRRHAVSLGYSLPILRPDDRLSFGTEYRWQVYQRLIKIGSEQALRRDGRVVVEASYTYPLQPRIDMNWRLELESRRSNDAGKQYFAPAVVMGVVCRWKRF